MEGSHSVWIAVGVELGSICSQKQKFLLAGYKLLPRQHHGLLRSEESIILMEGEPEPQ